MRLQGANSECISMQKLNAYFVAVIRVLVESFLSVLLTISRARTFILYIGTDISVLTKGR
jgi:hypothetical protein